MEVKQRQVSLEFQAQLLSLLSRKILQIQFVQSCEIELVCQENCRLHIFVATMFNWRKWHRENKICYFVSWSWNFALSRKIFFLLFAGCVLQSLVQRIYICVRQRYWNIRSGGFDFRVKKSTLETRWIFYKDEWVYFPLTAIANISVLLCRKRILACFIIPHSVATKWRLIWAWEQMKAQMPFTSN